MNARTFATAIAAIAASTGILAQTATAPFTEDTRQALKGAAEKARDSLAASRIAPGQAVSVFFIEGDANGYVASLVRDAMLAAGRTYVVPNDDDNRLLQRIYSEMEFDERKDGMVNPKTVERIDAASLKSTQVLVYGNVWTVVENERYVLVEMSLGAYSVATKEFLWAGAFDCRHYKPGAAPEVGIVDLPVELRETLKADITTNIIASMKGQPRLEAVKTAAILPLVGDGDFDGYITHIVVDAVTRTDVMPKNGDLQTRAEARRVLRDKPQIADGILWGAIRDLDIRKTGSAFRTIKYEVLVDLQLSIETAVSQEIPWSDTIQVRSEIETVLTWWEWLSQLFDLDNPRFYAKFALRIAVAVVAVALLLKFLAATTRVR